MNSHQSTLTIFADGRKTEGQATGVGHYERSLFAEMQKICDLQVRTGSGLRFHLAGVIRTLRKKGSLYFSPESFVVPVLLGRRSILTIHDLSPVTHPARHTSRNLLFHKLLLRIATKRVGAIIVPTEAVKKDVLSHLGAKMTGKTHVVYEGVRFGHPPAVDIVDRERVLLYVGTIEPRKNVDVLCRAFLAAQRRSPEVAQWRLILVGKRGWLSSTQARELDVAITAVDATEMGYQSNNDVESLLRTSSIFCYVSEAEGFGLPPLEAMALGTPVIVSDDAALLEVAGSAGRVVSRGPGMEAELSDAIVEIATDESKRASMQTLGLARARLFTWTAAARSTVAVANMLQKRHAL